MRIVLDTNIWISGLLLPNSQAGKVLASWQLGQFNVVVSEPILDEIKKVLTYPKIQKRIAWSEEKIDQFILMAQFLIEPIKIKNMKISKLREPNDSFILATFIQGKADYLVTGDEGLLVLQEDYPILSLSEFYSML